MPYEPFDEDTPQVRTVLKAFGDAREAILSAGSAFVALGTELRKVGWAVPPDDDWENQLPEPPNPDEVSELTLPPVFAPTLDPVLWPTIGPSDHTSHASDLAGTFRASCPTCVQMALVAVRQSDSEIQMHQEWRTDTRLSIGLREQHTYSTPGEAEKWAREHPGTVVQTRLVTDWIPGR